MNAPQASPGRKRLLNSPGACQGFFVVPFFFFCAFLLQRGRPTPMKKECGWMGAQRPSSHIPFSLG
ncbi:MAG TPA: hypothetical protein VN729_10465, partial [Ktedonobacteraceae bacterium]|nr:hypothetical protein [Ktedonobacteraceae bacterium]